MKNTYSITQGQREFPALIRASQEGGVAAITKHDATVAYVISRERWESMLETMELLSNPKFQAQLARVRDGKAKYVSLESLPE